MENRTKKKSSTKRLIISLVVSILLLVIIVPICFFYFLANKTNFDNSSDDQIISNDELEEPQENKTGYRNIAVFGLDSRSNNLQSGSRSDTIMLVSLNNVTKDVKLCSVYRDTYVNVPDHNYTKINHAFAYGGYSLALSTLNTNFDLNIREYVSVNFYAVTRVIDLLGGITLDIEENELKWLNGYVREINRVNGTSVLGLSSAGTQTVNGTQALAYARIRYTSGGDFKRTERQRIVFNKIFEKAKTTSLATLVSIVNEILPQISTNISGTEILALAPDILNYDIVDSKGFPFENTTSSIKGTSYVIPSDLANNVTLLHEYLFDAASYTPSNTVNAYSEYIHSLGY